MLTIHRLAAKKKQTKAYNMTFKSVDKIKGRLCQENFLIRKETFLFPNSEICEKRKQNELISFS